MPISRRLRIVIPGGTGHLGTLLCRHFYEQGHEVATVTRFPKAQPWQAVHWDSTTLGDWANSLDGADVVINLAGRSLFCRQTDVNRAEILRSRIATTELVGRAISQCADPPDLWLNASTALIYRHSLDSDMDEENGTIDDQDASVPAEWNFIVSVASAWEHAQANAHTDRTRRIALRMSPVMIPNSSSLFDWLLRLVRWGFGGEIGTGDQYVAWIHDFDFIRVIEHLIATESLAGSINVTSPCPAPNHQFMCNLRRAWCTSYFGVPAPEWAAQAAAFLARIEPEIVLKSCRVVPKRLLESGFSFHFPQWRGACENLVDRWRAEHPSD
jgi:uncharacterized protein (TIGR01777 family)